MFEIGFSELVLIMLIALLVLGPERLPKLAADVGRWVGRARAMARQLRQQLDQEVNVDEMLKERPVSPTIHQPYSPPPPSPASPAATAESGEQDPDTVHHDQPDESLREPAPSTPAATATSPSQTTSEPGNERPAA
jgi:sec-independent protein translocase protein TatB